MGTPVTNIMGNATVTPVLVRVDKNRDFLIKIKKIDFFDLNRIFFYLNRFFRFF